MINKKNECQLLVYTRRAVDGSYSNGLGNSIHMAYSNDGDNFHPLNQNYGMIFATASISPNNTIIEKGLKNPYIFSCKNNTFGILAVNVNLNGENDVENGGKVLLWTSDDLIHFNNCEIIDLKTDVSVQAVQCRYSDADAVYELRWQDAYGNYYKNYIKDFTDTNDMTLPKQDVSFNIDHINTNIEGCVAGNVLNIDWQTCEKMIMHWTPIHNVAVQVPDCVKAQTEDDIKAVMAKVIYSDGSISSKKVDWATNNIDFKKKDSYVIHGKVLQKHFQFPLAVGYADPDIITWRNKFYFIATNDNTNAIGLFVRSSDTIDGLFTKDVREYKILDYDIKKNFVKTFWAPEFHVIGDDLYILFAVGGKTGGPQSHIMKLKRGGNILNPADWEDPLRVKMMNGNYLAEKGITLDMTYFAVSGISYLAWSYRYGLGTSNDTGSMIYIATVNPQYPDRLTCEPVLLSRPLLGWENTEGTVNNEGPYVLQSEDTVYLAFSGGAAGGYSYAIGWLSINKNSNLLDPSAWRKSITPALTHYSVCGEYGPGHNTFFQDEEGQTMIIYHAQQTLKRDPRCVGIRRVHYNNEGFPVINMSKERDLNSAFSDVSMKVVVEF